ncbi:MAG: YraN family protein [Christensenellales bacterium]
MDSDGLGTLGEVRAEQYLVEQGCRILARNAAFPGAEIDLIAQDGRVIVFVEVKGADEARHPYGREAVTPAKQKRICRGALRYMVQNGLTERQARFDVIEIRGARLTHIKDAFPYQGPMF